MFDRKTVFIGSFNLDPRSMNLDTEIVLVVQSPQLAAQFLDAFATDFAPENAWRIADVVGEERRRRLDHPAARAAARRAARSGQRVAALRPVDRAVPARRPLALRKRFAAAPQRIALTSLLVPVPQRVITAIASVTDTSTQCTRWRGRM